MTLFLAAVLLTLLALCWDWPPAVTADAEREPASAGENLSPAGLSN